MPLPFYCRFVVILAFILGATSFYASLAKADNAIIEPLILPPIKAAASQQQSAVSYQLKEPGEFIDVDLPDRDKAIKYPDRVVTHQPMLAQNIQLNRTTQKAAAVYSIQLAMFTQYDNAVYLEKKLLADHLRAFILTKYSKDKQPRYHVRIGHYPNRRQAQAALQAYRQQNPKTTAYIVYE